MNPQRTGTRLAGKIKNGEQVDCNTCPCLYLWFMSVFSCVQMIVVWCYWPALLSDFNCCYVLPIPCKPRKAGSGTGELIKPITDFVQFSDGLFFVLYGFFVSRFPSPVCRVRWPPVSVLRCSEPTIDVNRLCRDGYGHLDCPAWECHHLVHYCVITNYLERVAGCIRIVNVHDCVLPDHHRIGFQ